MLHQRILPPKRTSLQPLPAQLFPKLNNRINKPGSKKFMKLCANNETISYIPWKNNFAHHRITHHPETIICQKKKSLPCLEHFDRNTALQLPAHKRRKDRNDNPPGKWWCSKSIATGTKCLCALNTLWDYA
jgi:hypothetical protein